MRFNCLCTAENLVAPLYHQKRNSLRSKLHKICSWDYNLLSEVVPTIFIQGSERQSGFLIFKSVDKNKKNSTSKVSALKNMFMGL